MKEKFELTLVGTNSEILTKIQNDFPQISNDIKVENSRLEIQPGVAETITLVTILFTVGTSVAAQLIGSWLYDTLKGNKDKDKTTIYIDEVHVKSESELFKKIEKKIKKKK